MTTTPLTRAVVILQSARRHRRTRSSSLHSREDSFFDMLLEYRIDNLSPNDDNYDNDDDANVVSIMKY